MSTTTNTKVNTITYSLRTTAGDILNLSNIPYGMSLTDENIRVFGSPGEDRIYVGPGLRLDLTDLGLGNDKLYFTGALDDYTQTIDQDTAIYTFTHKTRPSEVVRVQSMGQNDVLYFADGHFVFNANEDSRLYNVDTWESYVITAGMLEPGGTPVPQSDATVTIHGISNDTGASNTDYVTNDNNGLTISASLSRPLESLESQGSVANTLPMRVFIRGTDGADIPYLGLSGQAMQVVGSAGADNIYVGLGVAVDARSLGAGNDSLYFTGALDDYTQVIDQDTGIYTFTHKTRPTEIVKLTSMGEDDVLYFADGHIVFNALTDSRLYNETTERFIEIDATWLSAGGSPLITEKLQYSKDGGATWQDVNESIGLDGTTITLNDPTLTASANIQFRVTNQASSGAVSSQQVTIDTVAPATPSIGLIAGDDDIAAAERPTATVQGTAEANAFIELSFSSGFTRTTQADGSGNWSYSLTGTDFTAMGLGAETVSATATDLAGNTNGAQDSRAFNIQSLDTTPPDITGPSGAAGAASSSRNMAENTAAVHSFTANEAVTWSLNGGVDAAHFQIDPNTGELIFQSAPDFENALDDGADNTYTVVVRAVDGAGNASDQTVAITVTNANDNSPVFTSGAAASFAENGTGTAYTAAATDADGNSLTYTLAAGGDNDLFNINTTTGAVTFKVAPDFEAPTDAGADNVYDITVTASDGTHTTNQAVAITVTNLDEPGEPIDLGTWGKLINPVVVVVDGGQVYYVWDRNGNGAHGSGDSFNHNELDTIFKYDALGNLNPGADTTNTYRYATLNGVQVALPVYGSTVNGSGLANDFFWQSSTAIDNNPVGEVNPTYDGLLAIWDAHNGSGTGTGVGGVPSGWAYSNYWSATPSSLGHAKVDLNLGYVYDNYDNHPGYVALQVLSQITSASSASVAENTLASTVVYDANGWTGDGVLTWSLLGADLARFSIDADDGEVRFLASPDFEAPVDAGANNVYDITVRGTTTSGGWVDKAVAISVTNVAEEARPVFTSGSTATVIEGVATSTRVYDADATDDVAVTGYTLAAGGDNDLFNIHSTTGVVTFKAVPSVTADTVYNITVNAHDSVGSTAQAVAITVKDNSPIDLGTQGKLINPVVVDGGQVYYVWDRNGNGAHGSGDSFNHNELDTIFKYDALGNLNPGADTTNTYRYATLNGVQVALPVYGSTVNGSGLANDFGYQSGTAIDNNPVGEVNPTYDGLLAIWDAYNGVGTGTGTSGVPSGWGNINYWSATPSSNGHANVHLLNGYVYDSIDNGINYVALQVL